MSTFIPKYFIPKYNLDTLLTLLYTLHCEYGKYGWVFLHVPVVPGLLHATLLPVLESRLSKHGFPALRRPYSFSPYSQGFTSALNIFASACDFLSLHLLCEVGHPPDSFPLAPPLKTHAFLSAVEPSRAFSISIAYLSHFCLQSLLH